MKKKREKGKDADLTILVNYPKPNETIIPPHYAFRVETKVCGSVEISIDGGTWQACRRSVGYWWFDWQCETPGRHKLVARVVSNGKKAAAISPRYFQVAKSAELKPANGENSKQSALKGIRKAS